MTSYPDTVVDHRSSGKALGKSNFSQTCTLLSHFLKEKRSSGASMGGKNEPKGNTKDLISNLQNSDGALRLNASALDFLPQLVENPCIKKSNDRTPGPETPQLTILYAGKMLVFDAFPPEKATEIMELATKLASDNSTIKESPHSVPITTEKFKGSKVPQTNTDSENPRPGNQVVGPDMRYPRRASLVKFLEKRKERVISKGPYQINNPNPTRHEGNSSGCEAEDQCSKQLDLNL
ncbi:hypothetical protein TanjilG_01893 [Lupinus angustifolius]|uniref:Protein TIFY n=1 Tax=Lupinus angustifolius TaxID=3871 RepID=A0A394D9D0_LUPAN|nr:PREDICTED: protein TIFY 10a-like [Lupinus angustifolius]XP_019430400.1 PREDICTED: protein TIFY 10a-like [Lupinus angustifolius]OIW20118.1 hypothetical protein TanjilG_01891 [Lupinus angustifolius]OIW20120.1 hypothetical protein TanjilG_01893 [Lupinus angustifolius]